MDGIVTDTAAVHAAAWAELFDAVLHDPRAGLTAPVEPFDTDADYRRYVDGRSREDGVTAFLAARGVSVPVGEPGDPPDAWTVHGLAARKNDLYLQRLDERGVRVFAGTVDLVRRLRAGRIPVGLVTASRNADALLASAGLGDRFDVVVDGTVAAEEGLAGKPDPATFVEAARRLNVDPSRTVVVEDATSGVSAARHGGFGLVVGVDRGGHRAALEAAGAHVVLDDVSLLDLGALRSDPWVLAYAGLDPAHEGHREALTTLGNGYVGTRGAAPESRADGVHYPGTYLAGVYNRLTSVVAGREVEDEHLVNVPNWLLVDVRVADGPWWSAGGLVVTDERRELDLRRGMLTRTAVLTDGVGRRLRLTQRRLVSMERPHLAALETTLVAEGWAGTVTVRSGIDAGVVNANVAEYAALAKRHLAQVEGWEAAPDVLVVVAETSQSRVRIATAARTTITGAPAERRGGIDVGGGRFVHDFELELTDGRAVVVDKTVAITTSRDPAMAAPALGALDQLADDPGGFAGLVAGHEAAWRRLWDRFGICLDVERRDVQLVLNLHVFHLLQAVSPHTAELDAGVMARGLHGEGYRGHVFWDELFVLPVIGAHVPAVTRALLDYRWRRLGAARRAARQAGLTGALFPWQSGSDGREETPEQLFNLRSGRWMPDNSRRQRHVALAVAYNAWRHYQATGDTAWLAERGADLLVEVARLVASLATYDGDDDRFHIDGVMGPDEYHDGYPGTPGSGLRDNAYTNVLGAWVCQRAVAALGVLRGHEGDELADRLGVGPEEPEAWDRLSRRLAVCFHDEGIISQFDGYDRLRELDWEHYRTTYGNIGRLDLILEAEGDSPNRYKLAKQADVLMLLYLLDPDPLLAQLDRLGYTVTPQSLRRTVDYYLARTAHGSTLSRVVHASVLSRLDRARAWDLFRDALVADLDDTQGGTTAEGVHLGAMAGTIDIVTRAFAGMETHTDRIAFTPNLPDGLRHAAFSVHHRGQRIDVSLDHARLRLTAAAGVTGSDIRVDVGGESTTLGPGEEVEFPLADRS
ncbi:HAD-IA family hydrolase [Actinomarinicola tropica]|uniref:HAD-IA family hydrolase n=2 Tax=Actinomarinicola tropica TaxID=2789776 RepID=A0A5Q2RM74_9ACTN|nr:HAD-IA family hydrolase [Actinomarinicola tropica]